MSTKAKWLELAELCEQMMEPDRGIDRCIDHYLGKYQVIEQRYFTASLDNIVALIERELLGWRVRWHTDGDGVHEAFLENKGDFGAIEARHTESYAATPALALCAAFCRAMAGKAGE